MPPERGGHQGRLPGVVSVAQIRAGFDQRLGHQLVAGSRRDQKGGLPCVVPDVDLCGFQERPGCAEPDFRDSQHQSCPALVILRICIRTRIQQVPDNLRVSLRGGGHQGRHAAVVRAPNVRARGYENPRDWPMALQRGNRQRRRAVIVAGVNLGTLLEQLADARSVCGLGSPQEGNVYGAPLRIRRRKVP